MRKTHLPVTETNKCTHRSPVVGALVKWIDNAHSRNVPWAGLRWEKRWPVLCETCFAYLLALGTFFIGRVKYTQISVWTQLDKSHIALVIFTVTLVFPLCLIPKLNSMSFIQSTADSAGRAVVCCFFGLLLQPDKSTLRHLLTCLLLA